MAGKSKKVEWYVSHKDGRSVIIQARNRAHAVQLAKKQLHADFRFTTKHILNKQGHIVCPAYWWTNLNIADPVSQL